jgi:RNA-directed DNA polymerase
LLTRLTSFERHLAQGAATSTPLANILICTIDKQIRTECERMGITYSTWVDDLAFSGNDPRKIILVVITSLRRAGLRIARKKIKIMGPATQKILNGIILGKNFA